MGENIKSFVHVATKSLVFYSNTNPLVFEIYNYVFELQGPRRYPNKLPTMVQSPYHNLGHNGHLCGNSHCLVFSDLNMCPITKYLWCRFLINLVRIDRRMRCKSSGSLRSRTVIFRCRAISKRSVWQPPEIFLWRWCLLLSFLSTHRLSCTESIYISVNKWQQM